MKTIFALSSALLLSACAFPTFGQFEEENCAPRTYYMTKTGQAYWEDNVCPKNVPVRYASVTSSERPVDVSGTPTPNNPQEPPSEPPMKPEKPSKPNAGRGNGSEGDPDVDPGKSGGKNKGGD